MRECQICKSCYPDAVMTCPADGQQTFHTINGDAILENKYRLERRIGQGGMGVVFLARHVYLKTQHAIKIILPDLVGNDPQLVTRFRQEALAAAAIRHHNVIAVTDFGVVNETLPFLVMEYVEGESLHDLLAREKKLSVEKAFELMSAICAGVGAAHKQGIVHRDLKPLNVMILRDKSSMAEAVKILDFGLAKIKSGELLGSFIQAQTTGLMGSPYYMAPEQWADEEPDATADIYSLGVMLFQMLTGDVPFKGSSIPAIMKKHLSDPPPSFAELACTVPPAVEAAVRHTLEKDRHRRTPSVRALVEELRDAIGGISQTMQTSGSSIQVSSVHILTRPPQSNVLVDGVAVGQSQTDGWFLIEALESGNHKIVVRKAGFEDWSGEVICDGKPQQILAELKDNAAVGLATVADPAYSKSEPLNDTASRLEPATMIGQMHESTGENLNVISQPITTAKSKTPWVIAVAGIIGIFFVSLFGISAFFLLRGGSTSLVANTNSPGANSRPPGLNTTPTPLPIIKNEMVKIPGGKFLMGRNDGPPQEQPAHEIQVKDFWMDKTEVTNGEYENFVRETNHDVPAHWSSGRPVAGEENQPVVRVSYYDVQAFAKWRSKRDSVDYRLPTEEEWEYAARNGAADNLYPWGDRWEDDRAVIGKASLAAVGTYSRGANKWGVQDLIGNVWEWTSSKIKAYPGSNVGFSKPEDYVIRGGSFNSTASGDKAITSTFRNDVSPDRKDGLLGFRLVRSD